MVVEKWEEWQLKGGGVAVERWEEWQLKGWVSGS